MATRRKSIRLRPDEDDLLRQRYLARRIPVDQYEKRPDELAGFVAEWNRLGERDDSTSDVLHYMRNKRKCGKWPTLEGEHRRSPAVPEDVLTEEQWSHLESSYATTCMARGLGSDAISHDEDLAKNFANDFAGRTGLIRDPRYLLTLLMQRRKRKLLPKVRDVQPRLPNIGFGDIDEIVS